MPPVFAKVFYGEFTYGFYNNIHYFHWPVVATDDRFRSHAYVYSGCCSGNLIRTES